MSRRIQQFWTNKWLLSLTVGLLLGLSFPPFPFPFLQFPAFILIFRIITQCRSAKEAAYFVYPGFVIWNLVTTYWLMMATIPAGIAAILANAVLMALVVMLQFKAQQKLNNAWLIALLQTAFWVSFEYLHHHWDLAWPWLTLANGWSNAVVFIQYISVTGFLGISFWVILTSSLAFQALKTANKALRNAAIMMALIFPAISLGQWVFQSFQGKRTVEVVVAQPNFDSYQQLGGLDSPRAALHLLFELSDSVRTPQTDLIVWPENGIYPYISNRNNPSIAYNIKKRLKNKAAKWDATIIGGTSYYEYFTKEKHPPLVRRSGGTPFLTYNAALAFYPDGSIEVYRKHNLVPVVERFPFVLFFNAIDVFDWVNWAAIQVYGKGYEATLFKAGNTTTPALICYDSVYSGWVRQFVQKGAGFITIITNDGWWGHSSGHLQHFAYARLRAIELGRWVVRSANNGISGIIAPDGSVKVRTDYWTRTAFRYEVPVLQELTFYARFGAWLPLVLLLIACCGLGYLTTKN